MSYINIRFIIVCKYLFIYDAYLLAIEFLFNILKLLK